MEEKVRHKYKRRLGVVTTILLVVLIVYFATQIFGNINTSMSVINTQVVTDKSFTSLNGYVFRNEELITAGNDEIVDFLVSDGERVPVGKNYMTVYKANVSGNEERAALQSELHALTSKMDVLHDGIQNVPRIQDIDKVNASLSGAYHSLLSSVAGGNYSSAGDRGEELLDYLNQQQTITGKLDSLKSSAEAIANEKNALIGSFSVGMSITKMSDRSCYVLRGYDGYESVFSYSDAMTLTADELRAKINEAQKENITNAVGKRVYDSKWYLAVPISQSSLDIFSVGSSREVYLSELGEESILMKVERVELSERGDSGFAILSSGEIGKSFRISRYTGIKVEKTSVSGYRVPDEAIHSLDRDGDGYVDYTGVYVMSGNYVKFRRIDVISHGNGYAIVSVSDNLSDEEAEGTDLPYLSSSELIIVTGSNLYDGKLIK